MGTKKQEDGTYLIGITDYAQDALGDLVFLLIYQKKAMK